MKTFYALISPSNGLHYGYTFDEEMARSEAKRIEDEMECKINIYEFRGHDEF